MTAGQSPPARDDGASARFRTLFEATYDDLLCFAERRAHPLAAEDVVAEVFLVAWRRLDDVPEELGEARAWLFTVAQHTLRNHRRGDRRQRALTLRILREPGSGSTPGPEAGVAARIDLHRAWARLGPDDQEALTLTVVEGLTGPQAARVLGISTTALSLRLVRARRRLRRHLRSEQRDGVCAVRDLAAVRVLPTSGTTENPGATS